MTSNQNNLKKYASLSTLQIFLNSLKTLFATKTEVDEKSKVQIVTTGESGESTEDIPTLQIHKMTKEQYEEALANGNIDKNALYLTPDEYDYDQAKIDELISKKADLEHEHSIGSIVNLQATLENKVSTSCTINNKSLASNITLSASDVGAAPSSHSHNDVYYTETEVDEKLADKANITHHHDSAYDTKGASSAALVSANDYTDTKTVNLASTTAVDNKISAHNADTSTHNDIRDLINELTTRLNTLANSDDETLDQMAEVVTYIKDNKSLIDGVTTSKVSVSDIINNLTTNVTDKPLSAAQGVEIKSLIDNLQAYVDTSIAAIPVENWTFTLEDGSTVIKAVHVG